jgi:hypothetical protein
VRLIEPFVSRTAESDGTGGNPDDPKGTKSPDPLSYVEKAALSMVLFLRAACVGGASELRHQLDLISPRSATAQGGGTPSPSRPSEREGVFTGASKGQNTPTVLQGAQTPSSGQRNQISPYNGRNLDGEFESGRRKEDGDVTGYDRRRPEDKGKGDKARAEDGSATLNIARLSSASVALRAAVGMASQPSLRRLMIAGADDDSDGRGRDVDFISILSGILSVLPSARATATQPTSSSHLLDAVIEAEQAVLVALEIIAQIDAQVDFGLRSNGARSFLETVARKLLPAVSSLSVHAGKQYKL